jgi:hypothetical protein
MKEPLATVEIYAADGTSLERSCSGPDWTGGCPATAADEPVGCAGRRIVAHGPDGAKIVLTVAANARSCPLAALPLGGLETVTDPS